MSKYRIVIAENKVVNYDEVHDNVQRQVMASFESVSEFENYINEHGLGFAKDQKLGIAYRNKEINEIVLVPIDQPNPTEYLFETKEQADDFVKMQNYEPSIHLMPLDIQDAVNAFFNNSDCPFEDCEDLRVELRKELDSVGGAKCPSCTRNAIMRKYQDKVVEIMNSKYQDEDVEVIEPKDVEVIEPKEQGDK